MPDYVRKNGQWWPMDGPVVDPGDGDGSGTVGGVTIEDFCFFTADPDDTAQGAIPAARTVFLPWTESKLPLAGATRARVVTYLGNATPGNAGSKLLFEYHDGTTWQPMGAGATDVFCLLDQAADESIVGAWTPLAFGAQSDVRVRMAREDGDGATNVLHGECRLQVEYGAEAPDPPTNPCDAIISVDFGAYANWAAAQADGWTLVDPAGEVTAIVIDAAEVLTGTASLHLTVVGDGSGTEAVPNVITVKKDYTVPAAGNYSQALAGFFSGDVSPGTPEDQWISQTSTGPSVGTTLTVDAVRLNIFGTGTLDVWAAGPSVAPECEGGGPDPDPEPPVAATGGAFGIYNGPGIPDIVAPFNTKLLNITPGNHASRLNAAQAAGQKVMIQPSLTRDNWTNSNGTFNYNAYAAIVATWSAIDLSPWAPIIVGNHVIDEPYCAPCFGGQTIPHSTTNQLGGLWKAIWPWMLTYVRMDAVRMEGFNWTNIDGCWNQYLARLGPVAAYISTMRTSAQGQGLRIVWGMNIKDGGDGSSGIRGTTGNDADSGNIRWEMSAAEVRTYGLALAAAAGDALFCWRWDAPLLGRAGMTAALNDVAAAVAAAA